MGCPLSLQSPAGLIAGITTCFSGFGDFVPCAVNTAQVLL